MCIKLLSMHLQSIHHFRHILLCQEEKILDHPFPSNPIMQNFTWESWEIGDNVNCRRHDVLFRWLSLSFCLRQQLTNPRSIRHKSLSAFMWILSWCVTDCSVICWIELLIAYKALTMNHSLMHNYKIKCWQILRENHMIDRCVRKDSTGCNSSRITHIYKSMVMGLESH